MEDPTQISWGRLLDNEARLAMQELVFWKDLERERFRKEDEEINRRNMEMVFGEINNIERNSRN